MGRPPKLSTGDWVKIGLDALRTRGFSELKADILTREQAITRGSFYHHFQDVEDFHRALINEWRQVATENVIKGLETLPTGREALRALLLRSFGHADNLEQQMRIWAQNSVAAMEAIEIVDQRRLAYLKRILADMGLNGPTAHVRAEILYEAYIGHCWRRQQAAPGLNDLVDELLRFAES